MDPKIEALVMTLDDFAEAALSLAVAWEHAEDLGDAAAEGYPFPNSFEEVTYAILRWTEKAREKLSA